MVPSFDVPAQYFQALAATMPPEVDAELRYRLARLAEEKQLDSVKDLDPAPWGGPPPQGISSGDWHAFFRKYPNQLPAITAPGTLEGRIGAFIRRPRKFFSVTALASGPAAPVLQATSHLPLPQLDPIASFLGVYTSRPGGAGFKFGQPLRDALVEASVTGVLPADQTSTSSSASAARRGPGFTTERSTWASGRCGAARSRSSV